jgi:hypothetical protein
MIETVLHFVFTTSGAGCLVQALRKAGRDDQVIVSSDDFSFGPIATSDSQVRAEWVQRELGQTGWNEEPTSSERLWDQARFSVNQKVVWLTRRCASEYAGFLHWLWRADEGPCALVDLTNVKIFRPLDAARPPDLAMTLATLHPDTIRFNRLWELAEPLQPDARKHYLDLWRQLRIENAPLRVLDGEKLVSAPISFFDSQLLSYASPKWQKVARIISEAIVSQMNDGIRQTDDMVLTARIDALARSGRLEIRGASAHEMRKSEVRLPKASSRRRPD